MMFAKTATLAGAYVAFNTKLAMAYWHDVVAQFISTWMHVGILTVFWVIIADTSTLQTNSQELIGYFLIGSSFRVLLGWNLRINMFYQQQVQTGQLAVDVLRPFSVTLKTTCAFLGSEVSTFVIRTIMLAGALAVVPTFLTLHSLPQLLVAVVAALAINHGLGTMLGCIYVVLFEARGIRNALMHTYNLLTGMTLPLFLLPPVLLHTLNLTPFPGAGYYAVSIIQGRAVEWWQLGVALLWGIALIALSELTWKRALKTYDAPGM